MTKPSRTGSDSIATWTRAQPAARRATCDALRALIDAALPKATSKVWHGGPVWFLGENPVVGYDATAKGVKLLFWNGQAFDEPDLAPVGKARAAGVTFRDATEVKPVVVRRWLRKAGRDVFDSVAFFREKRATRR